MVPPAYAGGSDLGWEPDNDFRHVDAEDFGITLERCQNHLRKRVGSTFKNTGLTDCPARLRRRF